MNTKLPVRPVMDERITVKLPADEKRAVFEAAAARRIPVSELIRRGIVLASEQAA